MSTENNLHMYNTKPVAVTASAVPAAPKRSRQTDFTPPSATPIAPGSKVESYPKDGRISTTRLGAPKIVKSKPGTASSNSRSSVAGSGSANTNKSSSKTNSGIKSSGSSANTSRQIQSNSILEFNTPEQNQLLSQCDYTDRVIWATRVLCGGNSVNGFLRATASAQRIKKQRARQNNSTKMSRAAKAAGATTGEDDKKGSKS